MESEAEDKNIKTNTGLSRNNLLKNFRRRRSELLLETENSTTESTGYNEALKGRDSDQDSDLILLNCSRYPGGN